MMLTSVIHHLFILDARSIQVFAHPPSFDSLITLHRRNISYILKVVWNNPIHREALNIEARYLFYAFITTFRMSQSLSGTLTNLSALSIS